MATPPLRMGNNDLLRARARVAGSLLVDACFVGTWALLQWLFLLATDGIALAGAERWALPITQAVFALATLGPILAYIYWDLRTLFLRGKAGVAGARQEQGRPGGVADPAAGSGEAAPPERGAVP